MKVFVAGATGVVGRRTVARLRSVGHQVTGVARSPRKRAELVTVGARPIELDLFDRDAVIAAVTDHDAVVNLATAIPVGERAARMSAWDDNDRIRREGSRHLVDAALAAGASRYVQESIAFIYADGGDRMLDESDPVEPTATTATVLVAEAEAARFAAEVAADGSGIALRLGQFYGFDSAHSVDAIDAVLAGEPAELGPESAYRSVVTTDDAAAAVVAALGAPSGVYNVVDDRPLVRADHVDAIARALDVSPPAVRSVTGELPPEFAVMVRSQRVSNRRFVAATGWRPQFPSAWEGWAAVAAVWREHESRRSEAQ